MSVHVAIIDGRFVSDYDAPMSERWLSGKTKARQERQPSAPTAPDAAPPFAALDAALVIDAVSACGLQPDGRLLALNSYENRVYRVGLDEASDCFGIESTDARILSVIAKFYRPNRWTDSQIVEEHRFCLELEQAEVPAVAPLVDAQGQSLHHHQGFRLALYPNRPGRTPDLESPEVLRWIGRYLGRIHALGRSRLFAEREHLDPPGRVRQSIAWLAASPMLPLDQAAAWLRAAERVQARIDALWASTGPLTVLRLHGDVHIGNLLWTSREDAARDPARSTGPHFVDFDDSLNGPAVQDLWMLLSGDRASMQRQLAQLLEGYQIFAELDARELAWIEALRAVRMVAHSAWLARRWHDPSFPPAFPWFGSAAYWQQQTQALWEQAEAIDDEPLAL